MTLLALPPELSTSIATWVAAVAAVATLVVIAWTARYAKGQLDVARDMRLAQARPFVVVSVAVEQRTMLMLVIENVGPVPARDVRVEFDQPPHSDITDFTELDILQRPIPMLPPGQRYTAYWEQGFRVFDAKRPYEHPLSYRAMVTYADQTNHRFGPEEYVLDLRAFKGQAVAPKGLPELVAAVESVGKEQRAWSTRGLLVRTRDDARERRSGRPLTISEALEARREHGWAALTRYLVQHRRNRHSLHEQPGWRSRKRQPERWPSVRPR